MNFEDDETMVLLAQANDGDYMSMTDMPKKVQQELCFSKCTSNSDKGCAGFKPDMNVFSRELCASKHAYSRKDICSDEKRDDIRKTIDKYKSKQMYYTIT